nr:hypothetical protein [Candidatus Dormibacteraeota bacterium]
MSLDHDSGAGAPWRRPMRGRVDERLLDSTVLRDNRLRDPHVRPLLVYVPPGGDDRELPVIHLIQGFTGQVDMWRNRSALRPSAIELIDELF